MQDDIFCTVNYKLNKTLMQLLGVWPEQSLLVRIVVPFLYVFLNVTLFIPELRHLTTIWGDLDGSMESITSWLIMSGSSAVLMNSAIKSKEVLQLIELIREDWRALANNPQLKMILETYASEARRMTIIHALMMYGGATAFFSMPYSPIFLNIVLPLNESRPKKIIYGTDYGVDTLDYYALIMFHMSIVTYTSMAVYAGIDSVFAVWVQHCCALFEISGETAEKLADTVGALLFPRLSMRARSSMATNGAMCRKKIVLAGVMARVSLMSRMDTFPRLFPIPRDSGSYYLKRGVTKLEHLRNDKEPVRDGEEAVFTNLRYCIKQHQAAIQFADRIESVYSMVTAYVLGISMLLMSISGLLLVIQANSPDDAVRYTSVVVCVLYHLHHHTVSGQNLINHSGRISDYAYECDWYDFPPRAQKLLMLIIARAQRPLFLTAGKVYEINMHNFSEVVKTSVSYFTVLSSFRE